MLVALLGFIVLDGRNWYCAGVLKVKEVAIHLIDTLFPELLQGFWRGCLFGVHVDESHRLREGHVSFEHNANHSDPLEPWLELDGKQLPIHPVDPAGNARRERPPRRPEPPPLDDDSSSVDFDPADALLDRAVGRPPRHREEDSE